MTPAPEPTRLPSAPLGAPLKTISTKTGSVKNNCWLFLYQNIKKKCLSEKLFLFCSLICGKKTGRVVIKGGQLMQKSSYHESWEIEARLKAMGLSSVILQEAVETGELFRSGCTSNDPKSLPGFLAWGRTTRALREKLIPKGWERIEILNLPMVVNKEKNMAIAVSSGDDATGNAVLVAKTKYAKGRATEGIIIKNLRQLSLAFHEDEKLLPIQPASNQFVTWFLLVSRQNDEVFFELSLPNKIEKGQPVGDWAERIIFPSFQLQGVMGATSYQEQFEEEINVEISRKV
jgi:hypothetical protein